MDASWHKKTVALTGSSGSGKSTAANIFRDLGAFVVSADELARKAVEPGSPALAQIAALFGPDSLTEAGELNRERIRTLVFNSPEKRLALEQIVHPEVARLAEATFQEGFRANPPLAIYDCPLLFETGLDKHGFRTTILIAADDAVAIERIMKRDGLSREEAELRLKAQMPVKEKINRAQIVVENNGSLEELHETLLEIYRSLTHTTNV